MHGSARIEVRRVRVGAVLHIYHRGLGVRMDAGASREPGVAALGDVGRDWPDRWRHPSCALLGIRGSGYRPACLAKGCDCWPASVLDRSLAAILGSALAGIGRGVLR